jgi:hypothetical protein
MMKSTTLPLQQYGLWLAVFTILSWIGGYIHNRIELPQLTLLSPENSVPAVISFALFLMWWQSRSKKRSRLIFLTWILLQLIGGIVSVLPFGFLPFYPPQTVEHYATHIGLVVTQLPLLIALLRQPDIEVSKRISGVKA